ncbi:serine hydrolase [Aureicoccus marinus]|uniref:serine hydrolase n=1 Tax=Aureicoccus marinus TaxID=754435 RepID=UPI0015E30BDA|nr:serine hydrolase [Aureicoccus marinus]
MKRASLQSILLLAVLLIGGACQQEEQAQTILEKALSSDDPAIARVMANPEKYELQIRLSQTIKAGEQVRFEDIDYQVDDSVYFYPASTVKFAVAVAALEKLNQQDIDIHQRYYIEGDSLEASFADDIRAVFAISDNHANNRLFEYVGQDGINAQLRERGVSPIRIAHRLSTALADTLITRPLLLLGQNEESTATRAIENSPIEALKLKGMTKGIGFMTGSEKIDEAFDFSRKNYFPISAQNALLKRVIFPEAFEEKDRLQISESQREYLLHTMSKLPREQGYDPEEFYDGYVKFFLFGDSEDVIPTDFKIYNKVATPTEP